MVKRTNHATHDNERPANAGSPGLGKGGALRKARWAPLAAGFLLALPAISGESQAWGAAQWTLGQRAVVAAALKSSVPPELALAVAQAGRRERLRGEGPREAVGVMQVLPSVAWEELGIRAYGLEDPRANAGVGVTLLERLHRRYEGRWDLTLSHYRRGPLFRCKEGPVMHDDTRPYAAAVMDGWVRYQKDAAVKELIDETRKGGFPAEGVRVRADRGGWAPGSDARGRRRRGSQDEPRPVLEDGCDGPVRGWGRFRSDDGPACGGVRPWRFF